MKWKYVIQHAFVSHEIKSDFYFIFTIVVKDY